MSFTITVGPRQHSHSQIRVPRDSWQHFAVTDFRLPQAGGPCPQIYIPQEQGGPVITPGTGFPFRRLIRLAGLQWRYSTPDPTPKTASQLSTALLRTSEHGLHRKHISSIVACLFTTLLRWNVRGADYRKHSFSIVACMYVSGVA
jgi:hypothetical protein